MLKVPAAQYKASPQPSLVVKRFEVEVSSECEKELLVTLELLPHKTKLLREKLVLLGAEDNIIITFNARVLGPGQGTPSLLRGVRLVGVERVADSEVSDWQGFD
ncbi:UPF0687 protein C20orf27 homolog [Hyalella azteca]|uniref:Adipose-secreted signaling protein n=1 Tax=Hyalella azteca TaxID=294128 RepID=A0A8B7NXR2_HYAAZ|nr:UPF0687 protein C20orf27 homolog [Hyalella azteca]